MKCDYIIGEKIRQCAPEPKIFVLTLFNLFSLIIFKFSHFYFFALKLQSLDYEFFINFDLILAEKSKKLLKIITEMIMTTMMMKNFNYL